MGRGTKGKDGKRMGRNEKEGKGMRKEGEMKWKERE